MELEMEMGGRFIRMRQQEIFDSFIPQLRKINKKVIKELRTFAKTSALSSHWLSWNLLRSLISAMSSFLTNEEENAKNLYDASMTTIATFFSSVTATTLQFSYQDTSTKLGSAVNLFWFLSLVFSVSSGINSLMVMAWRKSSMWAPTSPISFYIYAFADVVSEKRYSSNAPPRLFKFWLDKSPMVCLIVSALTFVLGLNLFVYSSTQVCETPLIYPCPLCWKAYWWLSYQKRYVSLSTNFSTGLHVVCVTTVTIWFIYQLKKKSKWICAILRSLLWVIHPRQQYRKHKIHWKRNMHWFVCFDIYV